LEKHVSPIVGRVRIGDIDVNLVSEVPDKRWREVPVLMKRAQLIFGYAMAKKYRPIGPNPAAAAA